jgi:transcriptional regulator with XRE-family HTH domain
VPDQATLGSPGRLAEALSAWRDRQHVGVHEAANRVGVQARTWSSWETGGSPQLSTLPRLADTLGVRCADLLALLPPCLDEQPQWSGEVATALRAWRRCEAMSLGRAARRLGVAPSTVLDWEAGRRPRPTQLRKLVAAGVLPR